MTLPQSEVKGRVVHVSREDQLGQISVQVQPNDESDVRHCRLSGSWFNTNVSVGDVILAQSTKTTDNVLVIDNIDGSAVINPDKLVTGTAISRSVFCLRSSWLAELFKGWTGSNIQMIVGNLVHELFQFGCLKRSLDQQVYVKRLDQLMGEEQLLFDCHSNRISTAQVRLDAIAYIDKVIAWVQQFMVSTEPQPIDVKSPDVRMRVLRVVDVEDNIWTPRYGIKGKVDLTLEVEIHERSGRHRKTIPLELKTGRHVHSFEHRGQVSLYTMMLDGKQSSCDAGLLLYLKEGVDMRLVPVDMNIKKSLIQMRNDLTHYLGRIEKDTPELKNVHRLCGRCSHVFDCTLMAKAFDDPRLPQLNEVQDKLIPEQLSHLTESDLGFFREWIRLIHMENGEDAVDRTVQFWDETSEQREKVGVGFAKLRLVRDNTADSCEASGACQLKRAAEYEKSLGPFAFETSAIKPLERISLTVEDDDEELVKIANVTGYVKQISADRIEIVCSKPICDALRDKLFRIDLMTSTYSTTGVFYTNLLRLMLDTPNCERLRRLLIERTASRFRLRLDRELLGKVKPQLEHLNPEQQRAVLRSMLCEDYMLIQAGPGSGKTETIVAIVRVLVAMNKRVLITSHTHSAVDNILVKLFDLGQKFLRLGARHRIHPKIERLSESYQLPHIHTSDELQDFYDQQQVVACTCLSVSSHPLFSERRFDFCIVDEASQVLLPEVMAPLLVSDRFILVGDSMQLPPVVRSFSARKLGFDRSLLDMLGGESSASCLQLTRQYRMNREIMRLANECEYDNCLSCANDQVSSAVLNVSNDGKLFTQLPAWLQRSVSARADDSVVFLDTSEHPDAEHRPDEQGLLCNYFEMGIVRKIVRTLIDRLGLNCVDIGVVAPYQRQVRLLRSAFGDESVEVNTVDQFQGRDKDVVICSFVRSDSTQTSCSDREILSDARRLNVAITRAKHKLIMVGNSVTLAHYAPFARLFAVLRPDQTIRLSPQSMPCEQTLL
jgi:DNA replication ATP-dependent helicase Dna2